MFLGRPHAQTIQLKPAEMHIGMQSPQDMKVKKNFEMTDFLLRQVSPAQLISHQEI